MNSHRITFDSSGAETFQSYLAGKVPISEVLDHPAYQVVCRHAGLFGSAITGQDVEQALAGGPSPFYGLDGVRENLARIQSLLETIRQRAGDWSGAIAAAMAAIAPGEPLDIRVYPIIGYDMGIGLDGAACLNCNVPSYLEDPLEFLFFAIHECVHVIYERHHRVPPLNEVVTPQAWRSYFYLWLQNEGYAVYAPFALRAQLGRLLERDYRVLANPGLLREHQTRFFLALERLQTGPGLSQDEYIEICFGPERFTYRSGCALIQAIECAGGIHAVQQAFRLDGDTFWTRFHHLLKP